jgi:signal transduction histidine kinase
MANDRLAAEAQRARLAAEEASRGKSSFLANMSHELRTPLNTILGLSEALQDGAYELLNERQSAALHTMEVSGRHLLGLISDILDFSKAEAGQLELDPGPASVAEVCQTSLRLVRELAREKRLEVALDLDDPGMVVIADARRLVQILVNLLTNAVKFTPEGGRIGLIAAPDPANAMVRFTVWDSGLGIAAHNLPRLFQPFVQLDDALSRQYAGTGLGLSLVRRMTEMHGGRVEVESEPGRGSRFTVVLPWRPAGATET